jgi:FAD dependent oxidoreductase
LLSPSTGIIDSHALMLAYQGEAEAAGAIIVLRTPALSGSVRHGGFELAIGGDEPTVIRCRFLINAAGLQAPALARMIEGIPPETIPPAYFCRGVYFTLRGPAPFHRLIYPVPVAGGLGVHITLDLAGQPRFGPDVEWISAVDCTVDPARGEVFYAAIRTYWPGLPDGALQPGCRHPAEDQRAGRACRRLRRAGPRCPRCARSGKSIRHRVTGADGVLAVGRRGGAETPLRRELIEKAALPTKTPKHERPGKDLGHAVAEEVGLIAPVEIVGHRLTRDQRK